MSKIVSIVLRYTNKNPINHLLFCISRRQDIIAKIQKFEDISTCSLCEQSRKMMNSHKFVTVKAIKCAPLIKLMCGMTSDSLRVSMKRFRKRLISTRVD